MYSNKHLTAKQVLNTFEFIIFIFRSTMIISYGYYERKDVYYIIVENLSPSVQNGADIRYKINILRIHYLFCYFQYLKL